MNKVTLFTAALVVLGTVAAAGCTNNTNNAATSPTAQAHDPALEKLVDAYKQEIYENASTTVRAWDVTWNNATSATVLFTIETSGSNSSFGLSATISVNDTARAFATTQDATNFLNAFDKTNYSLRRTDYASDPASEAYYNSTRRYPSAYKAYSYTESGILGVSMKEYAVTQYDNIINEANARVTL